MPGRAGRRSWIADVPHLPRLGGPVSGARPQRCRRRGLGRARIGLDFGSYCMPLGAVRAAEGGAAAGEFVDLGPVVWELRLIKSRAEIAPAASRRWDRRRDHARGRPDGVPAEQSRSARPPRWRSRRMSSSAPIPGPPGPISAGRGWDFLHAHLEDTPLGEGDVVHVELTPRSAATAPASCAAPCIGSASRSRREPPQTLAEIQERQIAAMRPGARARAKSMRSCATAC